MPYPGETRMPNGGVPLHMLVQMDDGVHAIYCRETEVEIRPGETTVLRIDDERSRALTSFLRYWWSPHG
jgi:hypothetical protein